MNIAPTVATALQSCWVDLAEEDGVTPDQVVQLQHAPAPWTGVILQCTNGLRAFGKWFGSCWRAAGPPMPTGLLFPEYGISKFRQPYHYYVVGLSSVQQADLALDIVDTAGGWGNGDLAMGVDIESGEQPPGVTAQQVIDGISTFAGRVKQRTGRAPILYAGSYTRGLGISSRMGCELLWYPQWSKILNWSVVQSMGFDIHSTLFWQPVGDGSNTAPPGYPNTTPIGGGLDIDIMVLDNMSYDAQLKWLAAYCKQAA